MSLHILGICGTFMGSVALLAKQMGKRVTGADSGAYPPISTQLEAAGIAFHTSYDIEQLQHTTPDQIIVGNVMRRGWPIVEYMLDQRLPMISGARWVAEHVLRGRHVLAVAGTHGKTSTASMLAFILSEAGLSPGFLIGGVPRNFGVSAQLGEGRYFVIEADEYDTAFFDKRSKFMHYWPDTLIINNLEFDHADIFPDLSAIQQQFHHLVRTVPNKGLIIYPKQAAAIEEVLSKGCWTPTTSTQVVTCETQADQEWAACNISPDGSRFSVLHHKKPVGDVQWLLLGRHHIDNALAALAAAHHVGVKPQKAIVALNQFKGVTRRLEIYARINTVTIYDDFAHHPTAIASSLKSLRAHVGKNARILVAVEFNSYTMRTGCHDISALAESLALADNVYCFYSLKPTERDGNNRLLSKALGEKITFFDKIPTLMMSVTNAAQSGDHILVMSNGHFGNLQKQLVLELKKREKDYENCELVQ